MAISTETLNARDFLKAPGELMALLVADGALQFPQSPSGLFVASGVGDPSLAGVTGMDTFAWPRDTSLVSEKLLQRGDEDEGDTEKVRKAGRAFLTILHHNEGRMDDAIADPAAPPLPARVNAVTLKNDTELRNQFDTVGYTVRLPSILAMRGLLRLSRDDLAIMEKTAQYLQAREYWRKPDEGAWEEDTRVHNSSRGVVILGLANVARVFDRHNYRPKIDLNVLIGKGVKAFTSSIWRYGETPPDGTYPGRFYDVSHMILAEGINLFGDNFAASDVLVSRALKLVGEAASRRYFGDTYNATGFMELFAPEQRTTQGEGRQELRDSLIAATLKNGSEAQWPMPEGYQSAYWGRRAERWSHSSDDLMRQLFFMQRNLGHYISTEDGLRVPELFYRPRLDGLWVPGDHISLLWAQASTIGALMQLRRTGPAIADYLTR